MMADECAGECHESVIQLEEVSFSYHYNKVIDDLSMQVLQRDFVGLIGANGSGKTTMLRMIVGLLKPDSGQIKLFGQPLAKFKDWERIGYVPQRNAFNPLFPATVREVVRSGLYGRKKMHRRINKQDEQQCDEALHALGIEALQHKLIGRLSGGQQQRVFLARALINSPDLLILDEPTVGIDAETQDNFFHMLRHMHERHDMTFLMVSHDLERMNAYLGPEPEQTFGGINVHVKHSHELEDCVETDLAHSLRDFRQQHEQNLEQNHEQQNELIATR